MQVPGSEFMGRCSSCSNQGRVVRVFSVKWPGGSISTERFCRLCEAVWGASLIELGCELTPQPRAPVASEGRAIATPL